MSSDGNNNSKKAPKLGTCNGSPTPIWASSAISETYSTVCRIIPRRTGVLTAPTAQTNLKPKVNDVSMPDLSVLFGSNSTERTVPERGTKFDSPINNDLGVKIPRGSDTRNRFSKSNPNPAAEESKCTCSGVCQCNTMPSCGASTNSKSALEPSGNFKELTKLKSAKLDTPSPGAIFIDATQTSSDTENMKYDQSGGFVVNPISSLSDNEANDILVEERTTETPNIRQSGIPCASTSINDNVCNVCRQPIVKTLKQRNLELHAIRMDLERRRIELIKLKQQHERNEMTHEAILFQKEVELKEAKLRQVVGERDVKKQEFTQN